MEFKTISIIKHPPQLVWDTMHQHFPEIGDLVDDIASITIESEQELAGGQLKKVNIWTAAPEIPAFISSFLKPTMFVWTDIAICDPKKMICNWSIESHYFQEKMNCVGSTQFQQAMGGRGCKLQFQGQINWAGNTALIPGVMDQMVSKSIENLISKMIPNNFQKITAAVAQYIAEHEQ